MDSDKREKDCTHAFLRALDDGGRRVFVPGGEYFISETVDIPRDTELVFDMSAKVAAFSGFSGPLFKNRKGCGNITLSGGFFVTAGDGKETPVFCFEQGENVTVCDCTLTNQSGGFIRACDVDSFSFCNIRLNRFAKDNGGYGVMLCGKSSNGNVSCVKMISEDTFYGDMLVLQGKISDMKIHDVSAIGCRSFVSLCDGRMCRISISGIAGGCENLLDIKSDFSDVDICDAEVFVCRDTKRSLIAISGNADGFTAERIRRPGLLDITKENVYTLCYNAQKTCEVLITGLTVRQTDDTVVRSALSSVAIHSGDGGSLDCLMRSSDRLVICHGGFNKMIIKNYED